MGMLSRLMLYVKGTWFSLPVQLFLLHLRKYQILLLFWVLLFAVVNGSFLYKMGAHIMYLYPEYLSNVNFLSSALVGIAIGVFVMSWNITTFILHSKHVEFLATTTQPFLKYCFNNALLPLLFLIFYLIRAVQFTRNQELLGSTEIFWLIFGFISGLVFSLMLAFSWFFGADRTIYKYASPGARQHIEDMKARVGRYKRKHKPGKMRVEWYLTPGFKLRQPRDTRHYAPEFIQRIFKQHHLSAMFAIMLAFVSLIVIGYFLDNKLFQIPAAASITVIFAILIAVAGSVAYFLGQWSIPIVILIFLGLNLLYSKNILDPRNKAYGLDYNHEINNVAYNRKSLLNISNQAGITADSLAFINTLNQWKAKQGKDKPVMVLSCATGGGSRSATFTVQVLTHLDSLTQNRFFKKNMLLSGASGGIMGASWYRELKLRQQQGLMSAQQVQDAAGQISVDLLNPVFSNLAVRDLLAPPRRFSYKGNRYIKDRGYAFEEQLSQNTYGWLNKSLDDYRTAEATAQSPMLVLNAVITADGRSLILGTRPMRFLMRPNFFDNMGPVSDADAVCFQTLFADRNPGNLRFLTAMRMSATFPYVLPSVWLPTYPVIDVMDAGFRDNTGIETSLKFLSFFETWIKEHCSKVVLIEIRDKPPGGWVREDERKSIFDLVANPALLTQTNLFRFQEYQQYRLLEWVKKDWGDQFERVVFEYKPGNMAYPASLSFHLTQREKRDLAASLLHPGNRESFSRMEKLLVDPISTTTLAGMQK